MCIFHTAFKELKLTQETEKGVIRLLQKWNLQWHPHRHEGIVGSEGIKSLTEYAKSDLREARELKTLEELRKEAFEGLIGTKNLLFSHIEGLKRAKERIARAVAFMSYLQAWPCQAWPTAIPSSEKLENRSLEIFHALKNNGGIPNGQWREWFMESMAPKSLLLELKELCEWVECNMDKGCLFADRVLSPWEEHTKTIGDSLENGFSSDPAVKIQEVVNWMETLIEAIEKNATQDEKNTLELQSGFNRMEKGQKDIAEAIKEKKNEYKSLQELCDLAGVQYETDAKNATKTQRILCELRSKGPLKIGEMGAGKIAQEYRKILEKLKKEKLVDRKPNRGAWFLCGRSRLEKK